MRFLHTADWHLGRTMRGRSRAAEFEAVLGEVVEIAVAEDVQVMLVCGDIWDSASPSPESDRLLFDALREFIGRDIEVLLVAGNHDSGRKLEALGRLSELLGVYVQPRIRPRDRGGVVTFEHGGEVARVAAIPWVPEGRALNAVEVLADEPEARKHYHDAVARIYAHMAEPSEAGFTTETINLIAGHLFVDGAVLADIDGSERKLHITQAYGVSPEALPSTAQYVALGHIHQPQVMANPATPRTAYSGSLLQLDFGERGQQKGVRIIDAVPGRPVEDRTVPLTAGRELVELHGTIDEVMAAADDVGDAFIRAVLEVGAPQPGLSEQVREAFPNVVDVRLAYEREAAAEPAPEFATLTPEDLFARYYRGRHGAEPSDELRGLFREVLSEAEATP